MAIIQKGFDEKISKVVDLGASSFKNIGSTVIDLGGGLKKVGSKINIIT